MSEALRVTAYAIGSLYPSTTPPTRNLGSAIVLAAIADYRGRDEEAHLDAALFLYPETEAARQHYDWAVALNDVIDEAWLREQLDRSRAMWDRERRQKRTKQRRDGNGKRMGLGERGVHDRDTCSAGAVVEPTLAACFAGADAAAAGV